MSADCRVVLVLDKHAELDILERKGDWLRVETVPGDREGWVAARYVVEGEPPKPRRSGAKSEPSLWKKLQPDSWMPSTEKVGAALIFLLIIIATVRAALTESGPVRRTRPIQPPGPDPPPTPIPRPSRPRHWNWKGR